MRHTQKTKQPPPKKKKKQETNNDTIALSPSDKYQ